MAEADASTTNGNMNDIVKRRRGAATTATGKRFGDSSFSVTPSAEMTAVAINLRPTLLTRCRARWAARMIPTTCAASVIGITAPSRHSEANVGDED